VGRGSPTDLSALAARVLERPPVALAVKQYYPDAEVFGRYDSFWQPAATQSDLRGQVGVNNERADLIGASCRPRSARPNTG